MLQHPRIRELWGRVRDAYHALIVSPRAPLLLTLIAFGLSLPSLAIGLQLDDRNYLRLFAEGRSPLELLHESASQIAALKQRGAFAWWTGRDVSIHFLRPGSALTHWLDYRLWPSSPWVMHLANCVVYAALVWIAAITYRALIGKLPKAAVFAALMFAVDDSHAQSVGWIASRHVLLSCLFAILALYCHIVWRRERSVLFFVGSLGSHSLALYCGEFGVTALAYLVAYALVLEPGAVSKRVVSIIPQLAIAAVWLSWYVSLGGGVRDASWFRDPVNAPLSVLLQGVADLPIWLLSQLGGDVAGFLLIMPLWLARVLGVLFLIPLLMLLAVPLRRLSEARFFATGMLLSCVVLFATIPQDRLLVGASFGGFGWIASLMGCAVETDPKWVRGGALAFRLPHMLFAVLGFVPTLNTAAGLDVATRTFVQAVPLESRQTIALNVPAEWLVNAGYSRREGTTAPLHALYAGFSKLDATRVDARTLELASDDGPWCKRPLQRMYASQHSLPKPGETREFDGIRATVVTVDDDGLPTRVRFVFPDALESPGRTWLVWDDTKPVRWKPPAVGAKAEVPAASMMSLTSL